MKDRSYVDLAAVTAKHDPRFAARLNLEMEKNDDQENRENDQGELRPVTQGD